MKRKIKINKIILLLLIIIFIAGLSYIVCYFYNNYKNREENKNILSDNIDKSKITEQTTERMLQVEKLQKENNEIVAWLEIEGTNITYPVCQTSNNDFYINHNYKKEESADGAIFLDKDYNWDLPSDNLLIYGHNNKNGNMFEELLKYDDENYYKEHPRIRFTTTSEDSEYEIFAVFYSRVYYKSEQDVFRYYYFITAENEEDYNNYVNESKKASIYDTGITAVYGEQLLTLSTCEYSQEDGRFVVVAKKVGK